jgi:CheY-like chemotaxis protein
MNETICLVIDDMPDQAALIEAILEDEGFCETRIYSDPNILLEELATITQDVLIVSDFMMPQMNGLTLISRAKNIRNIDAIIVTAEKTLAEKTNIPVIVKGQAGFVEMLRLEAKRLCNSKQFQIS